MNTFFALELQDDFRAELAEIISDFSDKLDNQKKVSWVLPEKLHLTLLYVGETNYNDLSHFSEKLEKIISNYSCFWLKDFSIEIFPPERPRIIWVRAKEFCPDLIKIRSDFQSLLLSKNYQPDRRNFKAHITLGRIKKYIEPKTLERFTYHGIYTRKTELTDISFYTTGKVYNLLDSFKLKKSEEIYG